MKRLLFALVLATVGVSLAQSAKTANHSSTQQHTGQAGADEGERLFEENCGRCHRPPDALSPKITGSVLRHMRVRAMLSKEDEQKILKYLNP